MIGNPYGSLFEIEDKKLIKINEEKYRLENALTS
jgi:hypothetical protein